MFLYTSTMNEITITKKPIKSIRMTIKPDGRILVSAPLFCSDRKIQQRIDSKKAWIEQTQQRLWAKKPILKKDEYLLLGEVYTVHTDQTSGHVSVDVDRKHITTPTLSALHPFVRSLAKTYLTKKLTSRATRHGCIYNKLFIRSQTTKRGTCSSKKHISLNRKLITLPERIIDYVVCHELAHLTHMNHSKRFRDHCIALYPATKEAKSWLKKHGHMVG